MKQILIYCLLTFFFIFGNSLSVMGEENDIDIIGSITQITNDTADQNIPKIYSDFIVWADKRNDHWFLFNNADIYGYDINMGVEYQITTDNDLQWSPDIWDDTIIWYDGRKESNKLGIYNLTSENETFALPSNYLKYQHYEIYEKTIVWLGINESVWAIVSYDLNTHTESIIRENKTLGGDPRIWGNWIVWQDLRYGNTDIFGYNLNIDKEEMIVTRETSQDILDIWGDRLLYQDYSIDGYNITTDACYIYNLTTKDQIELPSNYSWLVVWGDYIVGVNPNGTYLYVLSDEKIFLLSNEIFEYPAIWNNRIAYVKNNDIYLFQFNILYPSPRPPEPTFWEKYTSHIIFIIIVVIVFFISIITWKKQRKK